MFVTRNIFYYDRQILCPHMYSRTCHLVRCASSITRPGRIAARITRTSGERCVGLTPGRESCIALTRRVADGFAQSKTDSQESESGGETASGLQAQQGPQPRKPRIRRHPAVVLAWYGLTRRLAFTTANARPFTGQRGRANT